MARESRRRSTVRARVNTESARPTINASAQQGHVAAPTKGIQLMSALNMIEKEVAVYSEKKEAEENKKQVAQAVSDRLSNSDNIFIDNNIMKERLSEHPKAYIDTYMKTHYELSANDAVREYQATLRENEGKEGFDVENFTAEFLATQFNGESDPDAVQTYTKKLVPVIEAERAAFINGRVKATRQAGVDSHRALLRDEVNITSPEDFMSTYNGAIARGETLGVPKSETLKEFADALGQRAVDEKNPELLNFFSTTTQDGFELGSHPDIQPTINKYQDKARKLLDAETDVQRMTRKATVQAKADAGLLTFKDIVGIAQAPHNNQQFRDPDFSEDQLLSLLSKSQNRQLSDNTENGDRELIQRGLAAHIPNDSRAHKALLAELADQEKVLRDRGATDEEVFLASIPLVSKNDMVNPMWKRKLDMWSNPNLQNYNEMPEHFEEALQMYTKLSAYGTPLAQRHVTNKIGRENLDFFAAGRAMGKSPEQTWADFQYMRNNPLHEVEYKSSQNYKEVAEAVNELAVGGSWYWETDITNKGDVRNALMSYASYFGRMGFSSEDAIEKGKEMVEANYSTINNIKVYTGDRKIPQDIEEYSEWHVENIVKPNLPKGVDESDYFILPDKTNPQLYHVMEYPMYPVPNSTFRYGKYHDQFTREKHPESIVMTPEEAAQKKQQKVEAHYNEITYGALSGSGRSKANPKWRKIMKEQNLSTVELGKLIEKDQQANSLGTKLNEALSNIDTAPTTKSEEVRWKMLGGFLKYWTNVDETMKSLKPTQSENNNQGKRSRR